MEKLIMLPMFESMDIEQDTKVELQEAFDKAVLVKTTEMIDEHVDTIVAEKVEVIEEEYKEKALLLEDSLDGYLDTVVEDFIAENAPSYEAQITDEKTQTLLELFDTMIEVTGTQMLSIVEAKASDDSIALEETAVSRVDVLEDKVSDMAAKLVESKREADKYLKSGLINEMKDGLSMLEGEKFEKIADLVPFDRSNSYMTKLDTLKESIIDSRAEGFESAPAVADTAFKPEVVSTKDALDFSRFL